MIGKITYVISQGWLTDLSVGPSLFLHKLGSKIAVTEMYKPDDLQFTLLENWVKLARSQCNHLSFDYKCHNDLNIACYKTAVKKINLVLT